MSRVWFATELETVATFWRIERRDGVALGFTSHDRPLWFDGLDHDPAPGMVPSAIRRSATLEPDTAEIEGALDHASITADDLAAGRFDGARVHVGVVDWGSLEWAVLYSGTLGSVGQDGVSFSAELVSTKSELARDPIPRTAPTCRAQFCGPGCSLSASRFTHEAVALAVDAESGAVRFGTRLPAQHFASGTLRWIDGTEAGLEQRVVAAEEDWLHLDRPLGAAVGAGARAVLLEGCDHTLETCTRRFANAINFRGEPFLPGNDLLARYPNPQ